MSEPRMPTGCDCGNCDTPDPITPERVTLTEQIKALLNEHQYVPTVLRGVSQCSCGIQMHGMPHDHSAHVAEVTAAAVSDRLRAAQADAWDEGFLIAGRHDDLGHTNPYRGDEETMT